MRWWPISCSSAWSSKRVRAFLIQAKVPLATHTLFGLGEDNLAFSLVNLTRATPVIVTRTRGTFCCWCVGNQAYLDAYSDCVPIAASGKWMQSQFFLLGHFCILWNCWQSSISTVFDFNHELQYYQVTVVVREWWNSRYCEKHYGHGQCSSWFCTCAHVDNMYALMYNTSMQILCSWKQLHKFVDRLSTVKIKKSIKSEPPGLEKFDHTTMMCVCVLVWVVDKVTLDSCLHSLCIPSCLVGVYYWCAWTLLIFRRVSRLSGTLWSVQSEILRTMISDSCQILIVVKFAGLLMFVPCLSKLCLRCQHIHFVGSTPDPWLNNFTFWGYFKKLCLSSLC